MTDAEAGQRLDRYLRKLLPHVPLGAIFRHLRSGAIRVDGKRAKPELRLAAGMALSLRLPAADLAAIAAAQAQASAPRPAAARSDAGGPAPRIVHRDDDVLVVDKPAGLAVHAGSGQRDSVAAWLDRQPFGVRTATFRPAPAHRLDRGTSGLVAIGLSPRGARGLAAAFRADRVDKVYLAVVMGCPAPERGTMDAPLWLRPHALPQQPKVVVDPRGAAARTDYEVLERGPSRALVRLVLHTGRTHQLRAHLAQLGHPIVGDRRYGSPVELGGGRFLLHAAELRFPHPVTGAAVVCTAPPPPAWRDALAAR